MLFSLIESNLIEATIELVRAHSSVEVSCLNPSYFGLDFFLLQPILVNCMGVFVNLTVDKKVIISNIFSTKI